MDLFQSKIAYCMNERLQDSFILKDCLILSFWKNKQSFKIKEPAIFHSYNTQSLIERSQQSFVEKEWLLFENTLLGNIYFYGISTTFRN